MMMTQSIHKKRRSKGTLERPAGLLLGLLAASVAVACSAADTAEAAQQAKPTAEQLLRLSGIEGGLIVHVGCGDGQLTAAMRRNSSYLVHGLDRDPANVDRARRAAEATGDYGLISIDRWSGQRLPYADNLVNLLVCEAPEAVAEEEMLRVLAPEGVACVKRDGRWTKFGKPRPAEIDEWSHYLHGPDNNAVAQDDAVGPPRHMQWVDGPRWSRSHDHLASVSAMVSAGGRVYAIVDEAPAAFVAIPSRWKLVARDAFSGVVLWKQPVEPWEWHLRGFRSGPPEINRTLVADGDHLFVTLGYGQKVCCLDGATGELVRKYEGSDDALEILFDDDTLFVVAGPRMKLREAETAWRRGVTPRAHQKRIVAIEADTGRVLWKREDRHTSELLPTALAVRGNRVYFQNPEAVVCVDRHSGETRWQAERPVSRNRLGWSTPTLVALDDVVLSADRAANDEAEPLDREGPKDAGPDVPVNWVPSSAGGNAPMGELIAFSAEDGKQLWRSPCQECYNAPVDVLVADGLVWSGELVRSKQPGITRALDPKTGEAVRKRPSDDEFFRVGMGHHRCYRNKATERFLVLGRSGVELIDVQTGDAVADHWLRGTCQYGVMPCNGMIYVPPHSCACFIYAKINGFNALAPKRERAAASGNGVGGRLEKGPAYEAGERVADRDEAGKDEWPTYRRDPLRSGYLPASLPKAPTAAWATELEGKLTSPVVAEGRVLVAQIDKHRLHALDASDGKPLWSFTAGGRIDSPPTIHRGLVLFGSADGSVYCLRAADGRLVWRFGAGPEDRRVVAFNQIESAWPVHGSVLVLDDEVYFAAGRSIFLDGGIYLVRLAIASGELLGSKRLDGYDPESGKEPQQFIRGVQMPGALPDVLSSDGESIFMRQKRFDREFNELDQNVPHLYSSVGLLDDAWWHRTYWQWGTQMLSGYGGWPVIGRGVPAGRILAIDGTDIYGFGRDHYVHHGGHPGIAGETIFHYRPQGDAYARFVHYRLFGLNIKQYEDDKAAAAKKKKRPKDWRRRGGPAPNYRWTCDVPMTVRAMVLGDRMLVVAGFPKVLESDDPLATWQGHRGGRLQVVSTDDGVVLADLELEDPPVFDGLAAAEGRLFMTTMGGQVVCFGEE